MKKIRFITALILTAYLSASAIAKEKDNRELLPDDYVFAGVDGKLVQEGVDKWAFEFDTPANIGGVEIKAGQQMEMLISSTLEKMAADTKERSDAEFRLWAKTTKFEGKNYLFPVYYLSLRKLNKPVEEKKQNEANTISGQAVNSPNDVVNIPPEIVALLKQSEVLPTTAPQVIKAEDLQVKQDTILANKAGRIGVKNGSFVFEADALGRGVEKFTIKLLPCQKLEDSMTQVRNDANPARFNIAGILTKYKGEQYLLLQKATRIYSYGNFGR